jgi:hypothetical protein
MSAKSTTKAKTKTIPGMEGPRIPEVERLVKKYLPIMTSRIKLLAKEVELKEEIIAAMQK